MHRGAIEMEFGDGSVAAPRGGRPRARRRGDRAQDPQRRASVDAVYLSAGGKDGYIGRDGRVPEGEEQRVKAFTTSPEHAES